MNKTLTLKEIISEIDRSKKIIILPHISADGDCLGSSIALALALKRKNKEVVIYLEESISKIYSFIPCRELTKVYDENYKDSGLVIAIDTGDIERLGTRYQIFKQANITVNIDHHRTNTLFASLNYVSCDSAAVGEMIFDLIKMMNVEIDTQIAICLYTAIITDTCGFRYSNTTSRTHKIAGSLIDCGIDAAGICAKIFDVTTYNKVKLMGAAARTLELFEDGRIALIVITKDLLLQTGSSEEDSEGLVGLGRNIEGVEVAVMLKEKENNEVKVNLRSNEFIDVAKVAVKYSGGGHERAAGCTLKGEIKQVKRMIVEELRVLIK